MPTIASKQRPTCPTCGKGLPKDVRTAWVHEWSYFDRMGRKPSTGNGISREIAVDEPLRSIADCRRHTNGEVVSVAYHNDGTVWRFGEWDGESYWAKSSPFCNAECALIFARASHRAGYRLIEKQEAA